MCSDSVPSCESVDGCAQVPLSVNRQYRWKSGCRDGGTHTDGCVQVTPRPVSEVSKSPRLTRTEKGDGTSHHSTVIEL